MQNGTQTIATKDFGELSRAAQKHKEHHEYERVS
jgi:hypothetical protein